MAGTRSAPPEELKESKMKKVSAAFLVVLLALGSSSALADLYYHVSIDLSSFGGNVQLQAALYNNSGVVGDSWALMDNVVLGSALDNFEGGISGTLGSFNDILNPADVSVVAGNLNGDGEFVMRIDEDPGAPPLMETFAYRDYLSPHSDTLEFDLGLTTSTTAGSRGLDEFVISILDPAFQPLLKGLTGTDIDWAGDILAIDADGAQYTDMVTLTRVPLPAAVLLGLLGFGTAAIGLKRQQ
jgi:hypothetical protein